MYNSLCTINCLIHEHIHILYIQVMEEVNVKVGGSQLKGEPNLLFETYGKGLKVKKGKGIAG